MIRIGTLVRILSPDYVAGRRGYVQEQESSGRWLIVLERDFLEEEEETLLLSLEESDFEVIQQNSGDGNEF